LFGKLYLISSHGITWLKPTKIKGVVTTERIPLTNFSALIRKEIFEDDGLNRQRLFEITGYIKSKEFTCHVPAADFTGMKWVVELVGPMAIVYPGEGLRDRTRAAIQELSGDIETQTVYRHVGWGQIDGRWYYLHCGGAIGSPDIEVHVSPGERLNKIVLP